MRIASIFFLIFLQCLINKSNCKYLYKTEFFEVPLDHFSYTNNITFKIRYLTNNSYVQDENAPIFFYTGNEGDIELFAENTGFMWEIAPKFNALLIFAEHRYYGKSLPFGNSSYVTPKHLGYLSSEQALADYADLLEFLNPKQNYRNRPVITFGGSYGGMLAAWMRMKYPHLISGSIAASAPILQFSNITPCEVFNRILTSVFNTADNSECVGNIKRSWTVLKGLASTNEGRASLNNKFNFCTNLTKIEDIDTFIEYLSDVYGNLAMVNYPYASEFLAPLPAYPVREFCWRLGKKFNDTDLVTALQSALSVYTNHTGNLKCLDINNANDVTLGVDGWDFQACTEMVMPMCSDGKNDMFLPNAWNFEKYSEDCFKKFGVRPRANAAITYYGGANLESASNIIFSNGLLDPWSGGGVLRSTNDKIQIVIIPEGAHHIDLRSANANDPGSVTFARAKYVESIRYWIKIHINKSSI